ncbi:MAG: cytochrome c oxidase subunit II [Methylobacterium mesophilicum]|nr:cytochrome c oxidase subunit II [Methylobacterium mesophilicum]
MSEFIQLWPGQASAYAGSVDRLILAFSVLIVALSAPVIVLIVVFAVKYRRGRAADRAHPMNRNVWLETSWALIPFFLILGFYVWSTRLYFDLRQPPIDALEIDVVAKQWMWKFQHPGGQSEIDELHVPLGEPVRLNMISQDAIHSLFIPALRIKQDVLPGRYTSLWFTADKPGTYRVACAEFCGADHSLMGAKLVVQSPSEHAAWLEQFATDKTLAARGAALFRSLGCSGCHGPASNLRAPSLDGVFGHNVALADGTAVPADAQYVRDSILLPQAQVVAGYAPIMPTFKGVVDEGQLQQLVAYVKSLGTAPAAAGTEAPPGTAPEGTAP